MKLKTFLKTALVASLVFASLGCDSSSDNTTTTATNNNVTDPIAPAAVYTMTNDATTNAIREYRRNDNGTLSFQADYPTGGSGSGDSLNGSSNGLVFAANSNRFYTVNAGSNSITSMTLGGTGELFVLSTLNSGGVRPISIAAYNDTVYVLNAGDANANQPANITGFRQVGSALVPIANSTQPLSSDYPNPAEIAFHPTGTLLVVTERDTNNITTYTLDANAAAGPPQSQASAGNTPFGFDFTPAGIMVVSEANGATPGGSSASSYLIGVAGNVSTVSSAIANNQTAACWVDVSNNGAFAYVTNTLSNNISIYNVDPNGNLSLIGDGNNAATGAGPIDLDISNDGLFLYVLNGDDDTISAYTVGADGLVNPITGIDGLPPNSVGLVAR